MGCPMTDLLPALSAAFKARDVYEVDQLRGEVLEAADPDLMRLWVEYNAILSWRAEEIDWRGSFGPGQVRDCTPLIEAADANLARLDTAWTAYLALRAQQQEPVGE